MIVELLYFDGCPSHEEARAAVERFADQEGFELDLRLVQVASLEDAERLHFLGSPTIRVDGRDVEPGADDLEGFTLACRVYRTNTGFSGLPEEQWIREGLRQVRAGRN